ncbi:MAG: EMC3/TMCO1 family protein [Halobacteriota archaeon]
MAKKSMSGSMSRVLVMYLIMMLVYAYLRIPVGHGVNQVLGPIVTSWHIPLFIVILIMSVITGAYSSLILNRSVDQSVVKESQAKMREFQKAFREAQLAGDKAKLKKLEKERAEIMELSMDVQMQSMKPMPYILVLSLPVFGWLNYLLYYSQLPAEISRTITMPYLGTLNYTHSISILPVWIIWYLLTSLVFTQVIRKTIGM